MNAYCDLSSPHMSNESHIYNQSLIVLVKMIGSLKLCRKCLVSSTMLYRCEGEIKIKMEYRCPICAGTYQSSLFSLDFTSMYAANIGDSTNPLSSISRLLPFYRYFHDKLSKFKSSEIILAMTWKLGRINSTPFLFH